MDNFNIMQLMIGLKMTQEQEQELLYKLFNACSALDGESFNDLLDKVACANIINTPCKYSRYDVILHHVCLYGTSDMYDALIKKGANILYVNARNESMIFETIAAGALNAMEYDMVTKILHHPAVQYKYNELTNHRNGDTLLHAVCRTNNIEAYQMLIDAGAKIDALNNKNETILHAALCHRKYNMAKEILQHSDVNSIINIQDSYGGDTPLHLACNQQNVNMYYALVDKKADITIVNNQKETILLKAVSSHKCNVINAILTHPKVQDILYITDAKGRLPSDVAKEYGDSVLETLNTLRPDDNNVELTAEGADDHDNADAL